MKTIKIDMAAYQRLMCAKREGESFSQTIKRIVHAPIDFAEWRESIENNPLGGSAIAAVEAVVAARRRPRKRRRTD